MYRKTRMNFDEDIKERTKMIWGMCAITSSIRAVASVGPGEPAPLIKSCPPPGWPGAVYRKFPK